MAKTLNLGKVGITAGGTYVPTKDYDKLTCVYHSGAGWISCKDVPAGVAPGTNEAYWQMISARGLKGDTGERGPQGNSAYINDGEINKYELVNNLTQGGEAAALSAEQGKILKAELTELSKVKATLSNNVKRVIYSRNLSFNHKYSLTGGIKEIHIIVPNGISVLNIDENTAVKIEEQEHVISQSGRVLVLTKDNEITTRAAVRTIENSDYILFLSIDDADNDGCILPLGGYLYERYISDEKDDDVNDKLDYTVSEIHNSMYYKSILGGKDLSESERVEGLVANPVKGNKYNTIGAGSAAYSVKIPVEAGDIITYYEASTGSQISSVIIDENDKILDFWINDNTIPGATNPSLHRLVAPSGAKFFLYAYQKSLQESDNTFVLVSSRYNIDNVTLSNNFKRYIFAKNPTFSKKDWYVDVVLNQLYVKNIGLPSFSFTDSTKYRLDSANRYLVLNQNDAIELKTSKALYDTDYILLYFADNYDQTNNPGGDIACGALYSDYVKSLNYKLSSEVSKLESDIDKRITDLENNTGSEGNDVRDVPRCTGVYNVYRKAMQLKNAKWTALSPVPMRTSGSFFEGDIVGLPYSSVMEKDKFVGYEVSLYTFMTAAHNPYSLLYTENVSESDSKSGYGKVYHGTNCGSYFGCVCNTYSLYAAGIITPYNSHEWASLVEDGIFEKVYEQNAQGVELGDLIGEPGHCNVITDIYRNKRGRVIKIYWSETGGTLPHTNEYTPEQFEKRLQDNGGIIYRYKDLYKNINYEYFPLAPVYDEGEVLGSIEYNDDICTFAGDKASFREGEDVYINYTKGSYTKMEIKDVLKDTFVEIELDEDPNVHAIDITQYVNKYGYYHCSLIDGNGNKSNPTIFEVISTNVSYDLTDGNLTVRFSSNSGDTPIRLGLCSFRGKSAASLQFSDEDIKKGEVTFNLIDFYTKRSPYELPNPLYLKVYFKGSYGVVTNAPIEVA